MDSGFTAMVVDDDQDILELLTDILSEVSDLHIEVFSNVDAACQRIASQGLPDVVISDFMMPGKNGDALLEYVRHKDEGLPFAFLTGAPDRARGQLDAMPVEADEIWSKPFRSARVISWVENRLAD